MKHFNFKVKQIIVIFKIKYDGFSYIYYHNQIIYDRFFFELELPQKSKNTSWICWSSLSSSLKKKKYDLFLSDFGDI